MESINEFLPLTINSLTFLTRIGVDTIPRPRKNEITRYKPDDRGILTFVRGDIEAEIPTIVTEGGKAYVGGEFVGKKVLILVLRQ